jgi:lipopolysaccharide biosynthesis glycosyltransferase
MQWFLALAESSPAFESYADMVKVAVHTALRHTSLQPHFLYRGGENDLTAWLRSRNIPIIHCRTFLENEIATIQCGTHTDRIRPALHGVLLRIELPELSAQLNLDERVLYTDCDVFFRAEVTGDLAAIQCHYFAVAPEFNPDDYEQMNTGVMWMNLPMLRTVDADFRLFVRQNLQRLSNLAWDQGAYREFFAQEGNAIGWDKLPPELNWKPYWGDYSRAKVVHFHGPKPFQRLVIDSELPELKHLTGGSYHELCEQWTELLAEAEK